jgi:hypothetical protein
MDPVQFRVALPAADPPDNAQAPTRSVWPAMGRAVEHLPQIASKETR